MVGDNGHCSSNYLYLLRVGSLIDTNLLGNLDTVGLLHQPEMRGKTKNLHIKCPGQPGACQAEVTPWHNFSSGKVAQ